MKISQILPILKDIKKRYGDIEVLGGCMFDDTELTVISVIDEPTGVAVYEARDGDKIVVRKDQLTGPYGIFLE